MTRYWVIAPYEATLPAFEKVWQFDLANGVISIGWHELGDISAFDKDKLRAAYEEQYSSTNPGSITRTVNMLWNFYHEIREGDIVLARKGTKKLVAVGTVMGNAYFSLTKNADLATENPSNFHTNFLNVQWHDSPRDTEYKSRVVFGIQTLYEIGEAEYKGLIGDDITVEEAVEGIENRPIFFLEKYLEQFIIDNFDTIFGMAQNQFDTWQMGKSPDNTPNLSGGGISMAARKSLSVADRQTIAVTMLDPERRRGIPGQLAARYDLSRQMTYYLAARAETALEAALTPQSGPAAQGAVLTVTPERLRRAVTLAALVGVSQRDTQLLLAEMLDTARSPGYVAQVLAQAETLAAACNSALRPPLTGLLAADEVFMHDQPILGVVHPASLFVADLRLTAQRDGATWGCTFLDLPEVAGVISDAGQGLAAGAALAAVRCHVGDWFHPLLGAAYVEAQYERQAYAALAKVYAREEKLAQTTTAKRWENHWQPYLREEAAAAQAIERYDHWRLLRWQLRALAGHFDWDTGAVRQPETVQAALLALAERLAPWAVGTTPWRWSACCARKLGP